MRPATANLAHIVKGRLRDVLYFSQVNLVFERNHPPAAVSCLSLGRVCANDQESPPQRARRQAAINPTMRSNPMQISDYTGTQIRPVGFFTQTIPCQDNPL